MLEVAIHRMAVEFVHPLEERRRGAERNLSNDADMPVDVNELDIAKQMTNSLLT